jgi:hypothetical protein
MSDVKIGVYSQLRKSNELAKNVLKTWTECDEIHYKNRFGFYQQPA